MADIKELKERVDEELGQYHVVAYLSPEQGERFKKLRNDLGCKVTPLIRIAVEDLLEKYGY